MRTLNIGCFGGGTGLPSLLGGLKRNPWLSLNAVVTMFDSGGSSGGGRASHAPSLKSHPDRPRRQASFPCQQSGISNANTCLQTRKLQIEATTLSKSLKVFSFGFTERIFISVSGIWGISFSGLSCAPNMEL